MSVLYNTRGPKQYDDGFKNKRRNNTEKHVSRPDRCVLMRTINIFNSKTINNCVSRLETRVRQYLTRPDRLRTER